MLPLGITQNFAISLTGSRMSLVVVGINHRTAPIEVRERVVFEPARMPEALRELATLPSVQESLIVSTCNRTEIYCATESGDAGLADWLQRYHQLGASLHHCLYRHDDMRAVAHAFSVASGLDSLVLGEPQILGQLKDAYRVAQEAGTTGPMLNRLFQATFSVAKRVRTETEIGANAVSVAYAAVRMARTVFSSFENRTALLVGAGDTIALAARHLHADGLRRMIVANRSVDRARELASEFQGFRHRPRRDPVAPERGGHRRRLHREPEPDHHPRHGPGRAARAQATADVHGGHRGSPRHRAGSGASSRISTCSRSTTCRQS